MTPSKIRFLKEWLQREKGRLFSIMFPAKYYYLAHMIDGDPENPLVEAGGEPPIPSCGCGLGRSSIRVYLAPGEFVSICQKCDKAVLVKAQNDARKWKAPWKDGSRCCVKSQKKNSTKTR